jgi:HprK-related kinase B
VADPIRPPEPAGPAGSSEPAGSSGPAHHIDLAALAPTRVDALVAALVAAHPPALAVELRFAATGVVVRTNSAALVAELSAYWREFLAPAGDDAVVVTALETAPPRFATALVEPPLERGKKRIKERYLDLPDGRIVHKVRTGMVFAFGDGRHLGFGPCEANANQIVNFVNNRLISLRLLEGDALCHASGVALGDVGLAMAGFAGAGKSTLSLHLMDHEPRLRFVSNDRVLVAREAAGVRMRGIPKHPRINPGTALANPRLSHIVAAADATRFRAMPPDELWELEHKYDALIDECFGPSRFIPAAGLSGFVVLAWSRHNPDPTSLEVVAVHEHPELLEAIMKPAGLFHLPEGRSGGAPLPPDPAHYRRVLADVPILAFTGRVDFDFARDACLAHLEAAARA